MLGLRKIAQEMKRPLPEIYRDPGYVKSNTFELSTSQVSAHNDILMTFGYSVLGGYGICYSNQCSQFRFSICTRHCNKETSAPSDDDSAVCSGYHCPVPPLSSFLPSGNLGGNIAGLRRLLLDPLEGISFHSDEVTQLGEENERLRNVHCSGLEQQGRVVASLRAEVHFLPRS
ncbi:hypothetical protein HPB50_006400 [Hyalomma asiaticum]|uniref:Uncharacterized protein n=1 Tax=Hyalomma asiaticum TaxID=266040 RepID=A0ACB7SBJ1_HYAAI|nr:hypothetical protein HPB50_006400 [Hyalomma asiaticum]